MRRFVALLGLILLLSACEKKNPNLEPPAPYDGKMVGHHKFDGGESDPYQRKGGEGGEGAEAAPAKSE